MGGGGRLTMKTDVEKGNEQGRAQASAIHSSVGDFRTMVLSILNREEG